MEPIFWIFTTIITVLLAIVGYFLGRQVNVIEKLTDVVGNLNVIVATLKTNQENSSANCTSRHAIIDKRLNAHSERLNEHDKEIAALKIEVKE